ncbi:MAG: hypothetical protein LBC37_01325, partial [Zoogloeaceae bacterium]|nr:hypothetical protein [Zoogloeaceae bacterium]
MKTRVVYILDGREGIRFSDRGIAEREQERIFRRDGEWHEILAMEVEDTRDLPAFYDRWNEDGSRHEGWYGYADGRR